MLERKTTFHNAASSTATGTVMNLSGANFVAVQITGVFTASVAFEGTIDASTWVALEAINAATGAKTSAATAAGIYYIPAPGLRLFRANLTWTSGTSITATGICVDSAAGMATADIDLADAVIGGVTIASGGVAAGAYASGSIVDGADLTEGAIADAAVAAGATGSISAKLRSISRDLVSHIVLAAGTALIGKVGIDQTTPGTTNGVVLTERGRTRISGRVAVTASQTGATVWDPTAGKKFVLTKLVVSAKTAGDIQLFDQTDAANTVISPIVSLSAGGGVVLEWPVEMPYRSAAIDNVLNYTTGTVITGSIYYEGWEE